MLSAIDRNPVRNQSEHLSAIAGIRTAGIIRANEEPKPNPVSEEALWLWGTLCDFEREGLLEKDPREILSSMTPKMLDEVHTLAPRVATWLKKIGKLS